MVPGDQAKSPTLGAGNLSASRCEVRESVFQSLVLRAVQQGEGDGAEETCRRGIEVPPGGPGCGRFLGGLSPDGEAPSAAALTLPDRALAIGERG